MLGQSQNIINNTLSGLDRNGKDCIIHIDYAIVKNTENNITEELVVESSGAVLNGVFHTFNSYVFFIQNNLIQHAGSCVTMNNLIINSNRVRIQRGEECLSAMIIDNVVVELDEQDRMGGNGREVNNQPARQTQIVRPQTHTHLIPAIFSVDSLANIVSDSQNVHNSNIVNKFKYIYFKMLELINRWRNNGSNINISLQRCYDLLVIVYRNNSDDDREKLARVLTYSKNQNGYIYNLKATENEIFRNVVIFIHTCVHDNYIEDTLKLLADSMLDCIENDAVVCLTGRATRMINAVLHLVDIHLEKKEKYATVKDARPEMLRICSDMYKFSENIDKVTAEDIKVAICKEFNWLDKNEVDDEVESWNL